MLWDDICEPIWSARNNIKHNERNFVTADKMITLANMLNWYHRPQDEVLDYRHRFSVDYSIKDVEDWKRSIRRAKLTLLNNAHKFYDTESQQKERNQSTIYN